MITLVCDVWWKSVLWGSSTFGRGSKRGVFCDRVADLYEGHIWGNGRYIGLAGICLG